MGDGENIPDHSSDLHRRNASYWSLRRVLLLFDIELCSLSWRVVSFVFGERDSCQLPNTDQDSQSIGEAETYVHKSKQTGRN